MGGKAFAAELGEDAFPRIPTETYNKLKAAFEARLKGLYAHVGTPAEAPGKVDHGDVDFIVAQPRGKVTHEQVKAALGATHVVAAEGNRTSNYAVPAEVVERTYVQVDVNVCEDKEEWERIMFFHSYGDMGMILGILCRAHGLGLGEKGLKIHSSQSDETHPASFPLSSHFPTILRFMGLSMDTWAQGFKSTQDVFDWVQTSRFFIPRRMTITPKEEHKRRARTMYQSFVQYSHTLAESGALSDRTALEPAVVVQEALVFFGRREVYEEIVREKQKRLSMKNKFTGNHVMRWTGLYGFAVRDVMHGVRERMGEDWIVEASEEEVEKVTKEVQQKLGLFPAKNA